MPSPDTRRYHGLPLYDRSPFDLRDRAVIDAALKFPGWVPREGNTELALIEALCLDLAEGVFAINRLPDAITEVLIQQFGISRGLGVAPTAVLTFALSDTLGHDIPAGTVARLILDGTTVDFATDEAATAGSGSTTVDVAATALVPTADANGISIGSPLSLQTPLTFVDSVSFASAPAGGAGPEEDVEWLNRGIQRFARLNESLVLADQFTAFALEDETFARAFTIDNWNVSASANGHVTTAVLRPDGTAATSGQMSDLQTAMEAKALANLAVHVVAPTINTVDIAATLKALSTATALDVATSAEAALRNYLDPLAWDWSGTVRVNELIALLDNVEGVDYVVSITTPSGDVTLTGSAPLALAGTVAITVT